MKRTRPKRWQQWTFALATFVALGIPNLLIFRSEQLLRHGEPLLLALDADEHRALIQGQSLRLYYPLLGDLAVADSSLPRTGRLAVKLDSNRVGTEVRYLGAGDELSPDERILRYRTCAERLCSGAAYFFFEEGQADYFREARYAELRIGPRGQVAVTGVRDADRNPMPGPP
ncbi:MAG: GDYXXLXY domain-containing protein [Rhodothermales bacterium]|nr:GDYXXLXY domain-containing protein [Rhodothermales bacterium]